MNKEIINKVAIQLNLPPKKVWEIYKSYWQFVRHYLSSLPLKESITEEEFRELQTSINIPSLGKFYIDWEHLQGKKKRHERYKDKFDKATVHDSDNDTGCI